MKSFKIFKNRVKVSRALFKDAPLSLKGFYKPSRFKSKATIIELLTGKINRTDGCHWNLTFDLDKCLGALEDIDFDGCSINSSYSLKYNKEKDIVEVTN